MSNTTQNSLVFTMPDGVGTHSLHIQAYSLTGPAFPIVYAAPIVKFARPPSHTAGGTLVTVTGRNFGNLVS